MWCPFPTQRQGIWLCLPCSCRSPIPLYFDSMSDKRIAYNPVFQGRAKHIKIDTHFVWQHYLVITIRLPQDSSTYELEDFFMKAHSIIWFLFLVANHFACSVLSFGEVFKNVIRQKVQNNILPSDIFEIFYIMIELVSMYFPYEIKFSKVELSYYIQITMKGGDLSREVIHSSKLNDTILRCINIKSYKADYV